MAAAADGAPRPLHLVPKDQGAAAAARCVVVLEDHPFQRRMLVRVLTGMGGMRVLEAASGSEALDLVRGEAPDLVIADLETPGMDGITFLRILGAERRGTAVVLTSAHDHAVLRSVDEMARLVGLRVLGVLPKPLSVEVLRGVLDRLGTEAARAPRPPAGAGPVFHPEEIGEAIAAGQVIPWFQPKVEVATGELAGVEALARWQHPRFGLLGAGAFVPQIETTPVGEALSDVMLASSLEWLRRWAAEGLVVTCSVNLPGSAFSDPGLAGALAARVRGAGASPGNIIIEVTETSVGRERVLTIETLARLRLAGFGLSLDDYGTGYASMEMLKTMPFTEVKVDRRFVHEAAADPKATAVLSSLLELASGLGLSAVAEGVERDEDMQLLVALDCPLAQGFAIARPMSGDDLLAWARRPRGGAA